MPSFLTTLLLTFLGLSSTSAVHDASSSSSSSSSSQKFRRSELSQCDGLLEPAQIFIETALPKLVATKKGETLTLKCSFVAAPQPTITWYHRGKRVESHPSAHFESLLTPSQLGQSVIESVLQIDCLDESSTGEYFCEASSPCSPSMVSSTLVAIEKPVIPQHQPTFSCKSLIKLQNPPTITAFTSSRIELPGGVAQLACRAKGTPNPIIKWKRIEEDDSLTNIQGMPNYMQLQNGDLLVMGDEETISESFRCYAINQHGTVHQDATVIYMLQ